MEKLYVRRKEKDWRTAQLYFFVYSTDTAACIAAVIPKYLQFSLTCVMTVSLEILLTYH